MLPGLELYLEAFYELDGDRPVGMGVGRIPSHSVRDYAREYEFDEDQTRLLKAAIRKLDDIKMKHDNDRQTSSIADKPQHQPFRAKRR